MKKLLSILLAISATLSISTAQAVDGAAAKALAQKKRLFGLS